MVKETNTIEIKPTGIVFAHSPNWFLILDRA